MKNDDKRYSRKWGIKIPYKKIFFPKILKKKLSGVLLMVIALSTLVKFRYMLLARFWGKKKTRYF